MKGRPLQCLVNRENISWPNEIFVQISESQVGRAIRTRKWKYSVCAPSKNKINDSCSEIYTEEFLYDLQKDPYEKNNLVMNRKYINIKRELAKKLINLMCYAEEIKPTIRFCD